MRITIYTANFGNYDTVKQTEVPGEFLYLTDQDIKIRGWRVNIIHPTMNPRREARYWKINSHLLDCDYSIWVDASFHIVGDLKELVEGVDGIACYTHGSPELFHTCLYQEAKVCAEAGLDDPEIIRCQIDRYKADEYPENRGLFSTGLIVRKNTPRVKIFNKIWWEEVRNGSHRDQISQMYASWFTGMEIKQIPGNIYKNKYITKTKHANK